MSEPPVGGAEALCRTLEELGVEVVFGLPGTQNVALYEALRRAKLRTVVATHELAAAFMANGYFRASGRLAALVTIPGPGFTYALGGLAEARLDSAALLHVVGKPADGPGRRFRLQRIDQRAVAAPIVKQVLEVEQAGELPSALARAYALALADEPGPVMVQVASGALTGAAETRPCKPGPPVLEANASQITQVARLLARSPRVVLYVGQGASAAPGPLRELAERLGAPVATTTAGRGVLPEDHPLSLRLDLGKDASSLLNELFRRCDVVLALGCKFSHNGAHGFRLKIPPDKFVHVDASAEVLGANYPASLAIQADVPAFLGALLDQPALLDRRVPGWPASELEEARARCAATLADTGVEPRIPGVEPPTPRGFFALLRKQLPRDACVVTDSGLHQVLARRHFPVLAPRGLLAPTDFQSMGFGLPAAVGAALACPQRKVVVLLGDGGLAISGLELMTAVREGLSLSVIVFNDGHYGLIRMQQLAEYGHAHGTRLQPVDYGRLAASLGVGYFRLEGHADEAAWAALSTPGVNLLEVEVGDSARIHGLRARRLGANAARAAAGRLRFWLRRG